MTTENAAGTDSQPSGGARFYRCALQVNPHDYAQTYRGQTIQGDALSHAQAIVDKAVELGIEVLAITDHNNVNGVADFRSAARKRRRRLSAVCLGRTAAAGSGRVRTNPAGVAEIARGRGGVHASSPPNRAAADAEAELLMRIEELELPPKTAIRLNTAPEGEPPDWQPLEDLSTGQKATAVLLLFESGAPLNVDQPEDDLDNRFITEGIVTRMREEKQRRQFIFSTHNANIPVLGVAELIIGLSAAGEAAGGRARSRGGDSRGRPRGVRDTSAKVRFLSD